MPRSLYTGFPFYRNYFRMNPNFYNRPFNHVNNIAPPLNSASSNYNCSDTLNSNSFDEKHKEKNKSNKYTDNYLFDLFGLKIFSDDVLLISLIYFLYSEGVKDDALFLVLILLLLS